MCLSNNFLKIQRNSCADNRHGAHRVAAHAELFGEASDASRRRVGHVEDGDDAELSAQALAGRQRRAQRELLVAHNEHGRAAHARGERREAHQGLVRSAAGQEARRVHRRHEHAARRRVRHSAAHCAAQAAARARRHVRPRQGHELEAVQGHVLLRLDGQAGRRPQRGRHALHIALQRLQHHLSQRAVAIPHIQLDTRRAHATLQPRDQSDCAHSRQDHARSLQGDRQRSATDALQVPLHIQLARLVAHLQRPRAHHARSLSDGGAGGARLAQRGHACRHRSPHHCRGQADRERHHRASYQRRAGLQGPIRVHIPQSDPLRRLPQRHGDRRAAHLRRPAGFRGGKGSIRTGWTFFRQKTNCNLQFNFFN